ncbi:MAG: hypothetical protein ACK5HY_06420 [Parahaliea sp.]
MTGVYVIRNQHGHYWGKAREWVDGSDPRTLLRVKHHDEGINTLFELSAKDVGLRGEVVAVELGPRGEPLVTASGVPLPLAETDGAAGEPTATGEENDPARA